jgi:hypothetical protein
MQIQQLTVSGRHDHPPQPNPQPTAPTHTVRRVGLLDRAAMHLGVALIRWGRRPVKVQPALSGPNPETVEALRQRDEVRTAHHVAQLTRLW